MICYRCGKKGHIAAKCPPVVNVVDSDTEDDLFTTPRFSATFNCMEIKGDSEDETDKWEPPTPSELFTTVRFNGNKRVVMECDSGASHNVLSMRSYKQIWPTGKGPSLHRKKVKVIMADGSRSKLPIHSMKCSLVASNNKKVHLYFYVIDGPHNLLGRSGLLAIWPKEYISLKNTVEAPLFRIPADFQVQSPVKSQRQSVAATVRASAGRAVCSSGLTRDLPQGDEQYPGQL